MDYLVLVGGERFVLKGATPGISECGIPMIEIAPDLSSARLLDDPGDGIAHDKTVLEILRRQRCRTGQMFPWKTTAKGEPYGNV